MVFLLQEVTETLFKSNQGDLHKSHGQTKKPHAFWTVMKGKNSRAFFDKFAQKRQFDPLVAKEWYCIKSSDVKLEKVCEKISTFPSHLIVTHPFSSPLSPLFSFLLFVALLLFL